MDLRSFYRSMSFLVILAGPAFAAEPAMTGARAYDEFTRLKAAARAISKRHDPSTIADCEAAEPLVEQAYDFLSRPDIAGLQTNDFHRLAENRRDLDADLAECAVVSGDLDAAIVLIDQSGLVELFDHVDNPVYARLKTDPRFRALADREHREADRSSRLWNPTALATPYRAHLTTEEKVAGLSLFWSTVRQDFAYIDRIGDLDWNAVYLQFLTRVIAAHTTEDYYRVMMQLAPLLRDGHTNIYPPKELASRFFARPPLRTALIDGKVVITQVRSRGLAQRLAIGDEIVAIDGIPVRRYADERVKPFASASTPQDLDVRVYDDRLLAGDATTPVRIKVLTSRGETTMELKRSGYSDILERSAQHFDLLPGNIAYLPVASFESDEAVADFVAHLPEIRAAHGLIIDVRDNGGGNSAFGMVLLSYLTKQPVAKGSLSMRVDPGQLRAHGDFRSHWLPAPGDGEVFTAPHPQTFDGPVALLIGPRTFSAAEDFAMQFDALARGRMYGSKTAGSTGQPLSMQLPGGGSARVCVLRESYPDGRSFVGFGIEPSVAIAASVEDLRGGRDPVLDRAADDLRQAR